MKRKNQFNSSVESLDFYVDEDDGFTEGDVLPENVLSSFSFTSELERALTEAPTIVNAFEFNASKPEAETLVDNRKNKTEPNTVTPSIEGKSYTVSRFYKLRYSTAKMLNVIKAAHPDVNVYIMNNVSYLFFKILLFAYLY